MSVLIIGADGNMGKRYEAILRHIGFSFFRADIQTSSDFLRTMAQRCDRILIATPTGTHISVIRNMLKYEKPILCEKPLSTDLKEIEWLEHEPLAHKHLQMILQYREMIGSSTRALGVESHYDYFRHGNDGLAWDCIQIIGLSKWAPKLEEKSPVWKCKIDGRILEAAHIDLAYLSFIRKWLSGSQQTSFSEILDMHRATSEIHEKYAKQSNNRHTS